jgi:hypothetical protein
MGVYPISARPAAYAASATWLIRPCDARYLCICPVVKARFLLSQHKRVRAMSEKYNVFNHVRQLMTFAIQPGLVIFKFRQVLVV